MSNSVQEMLILSTKEGLCYLCEIVTVMTSSQKNKIILFIILALVVLLSSMEWKYKLVVGHSHSSLINSDSEEENKQLIKSVKEIKLNNCGCIRTISINPTKNNYESTTCGRDAFERGDDQKVIAFSLYSENSERSQVCRLITR